MQRHPSLLFRILKANPAIIQCQKSFNIAFQQQEMMKHYVAGIQLDARQYNQVVMKQKTENWSRNPLYTAQWNRETAFSTNTDVAIRYPQSLKLWPKPHILQ